MNKEFKPTAAMKNAATKGLNLYSEQKGKDITPRAIEVAKKISSGQKLTSEHVIDMAHYHSSHDGNCPGDVGDLLWGGPAGNVWSKANIINTIEDKFPKHLSAMMGEGDNLAFEIYSKFDLDEPIKAGKDSDGLMWYPILRSGELATRPGPMGEKLDEPLIFVPGHSENQEKEIGLQDVVDAFNDNAVEFVTIPTSHKNELLENTGFIKGLKIVDSKKNPGQKIVLAAHKFTEPDVEGKVERGTIPSRSSGLLYNYKNTTTGKVYPIVLEHTALTHKPWVGGMTPYGSDSTDFSERNIISMMLSEPSTIPNEIPKLDPPSVKLKFENKPINSNKDKEEKSFLADVVWGEDLSFRDVQNQISNIIEKYQSDEDSYPIYSVIDCNAEKALIRVRYGIGPDEDAWVVPYTIDDMKVVHLAPFAEWVDASKKWVTDTVDPKWDKEQLDRLNPMNMSEKEIMGLSESVAVELGVLSYKERQKLPDSDFVFPDSKSYPIHDIVHAKNALARVAQNGTPDEQAKVKAAVYKRYPELKKDKEEKMSSDPLKLASERRSNANNPPGGHMTLLAMSEEQMERLGLSDEAKDVLRKQNEKIVALGQEVEKSKAAERAAKIEKEILDLGEKGFKAYPDLLEEIKNIKLSDDGDVAIKLTLSENGSSFKVDQTASQIVDRIISKLPSKDGKISFSEMPNLLQSPLDKRPPEQLSEEEKKKIKSGVELAEQWAEADPSIKKEFAFLFDENGKGK